jgi:hypothetical protein
MNSGHYIVHGHACGALQFLCLTPLTVHAVLSLSILSCVGSRVHLLGLKCACLYLRTGTESCLQMPFTNKSQSTGNAQNINNCIAVYFLSLQNLP